MKSEDAGSRANRKLAKRSVVRRQARSGRRAETAGDRRRRLRAIAGDPEIVRVDGGAACPICGLPYRDHPWDTGNVDFNDDPYLRIACDQTRLKL